MVHYNTVLDITLVIVGPELVILDSRLNTDWIANKEIGLYPNNSAIKRLRCILKV